MENILVSNITAARESGWLNYETFKTWAMENGYGDHLSIDRKDSDKDYCPDNCQFITKSENSRKAIAKSLDTIRNRPHIM